jgi:hypothetical protein
MWVCRALWAALLTLVVSLAFSWPVPAQFWIGQVSSSAPPPTISVTCTFTTGNCTGTGGGTALFTPATCDGVTDDAPAVISFNSWVRATWQASHTGQVKLLGPSGGSCNVLSGTVSCNSNPNPLCPFIGIKTFLYDGQGGSLNFAANVLNSLGGGAGIRQNNSNSVPTASANIGDTCVTLLLQTPIVSVSAVSSNSGATELTVSSTSGYSNGQTVFINNISNTSSAFFNGQQVIDVIDGTHLNLPSVPFQSGYSGGAKIGDVTSIFTVGNPVEMAGLDTQEVWQSPFGFPPNPQFWEYLFVASINSGTGQVCFTGALTNKYLSTWPRYNSGNQFEVDPGGPATLYSLDPTWDATVEFDNVTLGSPGQIYSKNKSITYNNVIFSGLCAVPTETMLWAAINSDFTSCGTVEVDKIIDTMVSTNSQFRIVLFQSASVKLFQVNNTTMTQQQGSPIAQTGSGNTFSTALKVGAISFGRTKSFSCTSCNIASFSAPGIVQTALNSYPMTLGVIKFPNGSRITGLANSTSSPGSVALIVVDSSGWTTGQTGLISTGTPLDGVTWAFNIDDATHITLVGSTYTGQVGSGYVCRADAPGSYCAASWAIPGANIFLSGLHGVVETLGQITDVSQDATFTYVTTTFPGGYPADVTTLSTHPAPIFTLTGSMSSSDAQVASLAQAPPGAPLYSYQTYTYPGTIGTGVQGPFILWGLATLVDINVTSPSSGAATFKLSQFDNWPVYVSGSQTNFGANVDAHTVADNNVTPSSTWFGGEANSGAQFTSNPGAGASVTVTMQTNQGVVNYLLRRDLSPVSNDNRPMGVDVAA